MYRNIPEYKPYSNNFSPSRRYVFIRYVFIHRISISSIIFYITVNSGIAETR